MNIATPGRESPSVGYLAVIEDPRFGFTGGLLVVSAQGRPLEFHCSTPLLPTRAQEILFGPTLRPYVCGELIAGSLVAAAKIKPTVLLLRDPAAAPPGASVPTLLVQAAPQDEETPPGEADWLAIGETRLVLLAGAERGLSEIRQPLETLGGHVAIDEPFERVHEAIREAQRISGQEAAVGNAA